jgi:tetratricopeptide (TPR) repeat protein
VRKVLFALLLLGSSAALLPSGPQMTRAFQRSAPHPEMAGYLEHRLRKEGDVPDLLRELIRIRRQEGDRAGEIALRRRLDAADPEDAANLEALVDAYMWTNRNEDAYRLARRLMGKFPERRELHALLLDLAGFTGRGEEEYEHALWLLQHGIRDPRMVRASIAARDARMLSAVISAPDQRSEALVAMGAQKEAIEACLEQLAMDPGDLATMYRLALLYRWNHRPLDSAALLEKILWLRDDPAIRAELLDLYRGVSRIDLMLPHLPEGKERAELLLAMGRLEEAKALYWKLGMFETLLSISHGAASEEEEIVVREKMPMTRENRARLADLYTWRKEFRKAVALYEGLNDERAIDLHLALGDMQSALRVARKLDQHQRLGDLYLWSGDLPKAIAEYEKVDPDGRELARLYLAVGRKADAIRILDKLVDDDPWVLAELYLNAGRSDRTAQILRAMDPAELDPRRVQLILRMGDLKTQVELYLLLLERDPKNVAFLTALAQIYEWMENREGLIRTLRTLLELKPNDGDLHAKLGLLLNDRKLLERAAELGCREPRVYRVLAEIARAEKRPADAVALYRKFHALDPGDAESHFALGELTGDRSEYDLAWSLLAPGERKIRARILIYRKELEAAIEILKEDRDWETLVDLLFELKRFKEALQYPLTVRQRAVLSYLLGHYEEAVKLLKQLDLKDPSLRVALGDSLFALGRWREAEEYASAELKRHIDLSYGPEESGGVQVLHGPLDQQLAASGHHRMYLGQPTYVRLNLQARDLKGKIPALSTNESTQVEEADASFNFLIVPAFRLALAAGGWHSDIDSGAEGTAELELKKDTWNVGLLASANRPWDDNIRTAILGGSRNGGVGRSFVSAIPQRLLLSGAVEQWWYTSHEDGGKGLDAERLSEIRARARTELRLSTGEGSTGQYFYDLTLAQDSVIDTHFGISVQADYSKISGSSALLGFTQLAPTTEMYSLGPTASWADGTWGLSATAFVGLDPARDLTFGKLWGGTAGLVLIPADRWRITSTFDYVSESRTAVKGASWTGLVGLNYNF